MGYAGWNRAVRTSCVVGTRKTTRTLAPECSPSYPAYLPRLVSCPKQFLQMKLALDRRQFSLLSAHFAASARCLYQRPLWTMTSCSGLAKRSPELLTSTCFLNLSAGVSALGSDNAKAQIKISRTEICSGLASYHDEHGQFFIFLPQHFYLNISTQFRLHIPFIHSAFEPPSTAELLRMGNIELVL